VVGKAVVCFVGDPDAVRDPLNVNMARPKRPGLSIDRELRDRKAKLNSPLTFRSRRLLDSRNRPRRLNPGRACKFPHDRRRITGVTRLLDLRLCPSGASTLGDENLGWSFESNATTWFETVQRKQGRPWCVFIRGDVIRYWQPRIKREQQAAIDNETGTAATRRSGNDGFCEKTKKKQPFPMRSWLGH